MIWRASMCVELMPNSRNAAATMRLENSSPKLTIRSETRGVSSRIAASPRKISSSESNFRSMRSTSAAESVSNAAAVSRWRERRRELMASAPVRSPCAAVAAARSSWSVTLAMALTTTMGCLPRATRPATMAAVRRMAAGSSTDVPPNFMTTRLMRVFLWFSAC